MKPKARRGGFCFSDDKSVCRLWSYPSASLVTGHPPLPVPNFTPFPATSPLSSQLSPPFLPSRGHSRPTSRHTSFCVSVCPMRAFCQLLCRSQHFSYKRRRHLTLARYRASLLLAAYPRHSGVTRRYNRPLPRRLQL